MARTRRLAALLLVPLAFMLMGARAVLVDPPPIEVPTGIAATDVSKAIRTGIVRRGWVVGKDENGVIDATLVLRTHTAKVAIAYNTSDVQIKYVSSDDLDYTERDGKRYIHANYLKWVRNMVTDIQGELRVLTIK